MSVEWNKVTWYSKFLAIVLFACALLFGFWAGAKYGRAQQEIKRLDIFLQGFEQGKLSQSGVVRIPHDSPSYLLFASPKNSEPFCLGQEYALRWIHSDIGEVRISIHDDGGSYEVASVFADDGQFKWIAGEVSRTISGPTLSTLGEGFEYEMRISSLDDEEISDFVRPVFLIRCEG